MEVSLVTIVYLLADIHVSTKWDNRQTVNDSLFCTYMPDTTLLPSAHKVSILNLLGAFDSNYYYLLQLKAKCDY